jgi:hypothetical protein
MRLRPSVFVIDFWNSATLEHGFMFTWGTLESAIWMTLYAAGQAIYTLSEFMSVSSSACNSKSRRYNEDDCHRTGVALSGIPAFIGLCVCVAAGCVTVWTVKTRNPSADSDDLRGYKYLRWVYSTLAGLSWFTFGLKVHFRLMTVVDAFAFIFSVANPLEDCRTLYVWLVFIPALLIFMVFAMFYACCKPLCPKDVTDVMENPPQAAWFMPHAIRYNLDRSEFDRSKPESYAGRIVKACYPSLLQVEPDPVRVSTVSSRAAEPHASPATFTQLEMHHDQLSAPPEDAHDPQRPQTAYMLLV